MGGENADVLICVGGDGTILDTLSIVRDSGVPVLALNTGRLGFLADVQLENLGIALDDIEKEIIPLKRDRCYIWNHLIRYLIIHLPSMIL